MHNRKRRFNDGKRDITRAQAVEAILNGTRPLPDIYKIAENNCSNNHAIKGRIVRYISNGVCIVCDALKETERLKGLLDLTIPYTKNKDLTAIDKLEEMNTRKQLKEELGDVWDE